MVSGRIVWNLPPTFRQQKLIPVVSRQRNKTLDDLEEKNISRLKRKFSVTENKSVKTARLPPR